MWTKRLCSVVQKVHEDNLLFQFSHNKVMIPKKFLDGVDVANKFLNPFNNFKKVHIVNSEQKKRILPCIMFCCKLTISLYSVRRTLCLSIIMGLEEILASAKAQNNAPQ